MSLTNFAEQRLLEHFLRGVSYTAPVTVYMSLLRAEPGEDGSGGNEPVGLGGYTRQAITFGTFSSRQIASNTAPVWSPTVDWGVCPHAGLHDAPSGGNMLWSTASPDTPGLAGLTPVPNLVASSSFTIPIGDVILRLDAAQDTFSGVAPYLCQRMLEHMFKAAGHASITTRKAHLLTAATTPDGIGGTYLVAGDYTPQDANFAAYTTATGGCNLLADITFRTAGAGAAWGNLPGWVLRDGVDPVTSNLLYVSRISPVPNVGAGAAMALLAASTRVGLN
jgi:hypothetical protein